MPGTVPALKAWTVPENRPLSSVLLRNGLQESSLGGIC